MSPKGMIRSALFSKILRRLTRIRVRPFARLRHWTAANRIRLCREEIDTVTKYGFMIGASPSDWVSHRIFFDAEYDEAMSRLLLLLLRQGDVALDVGAQRGWFALLMAAAVGGEGSVHAFEASPAIAEKMVANVAKNQFGQVRVVACAVGDRDGEIGFTEAADVEPHGEASLRHNSGLGRVSNSPDATRVPCMTLDTYVRQNSIGKIRLIKMDIEGAELLALRGAHHVLDSLHPILVLELNKLCGRGREAVRDTCGLLEAQEYRLFTYDGTRLRLFDLRSFLTCGPSEINVWCFHRGVLPL